ncbi:Cof-type HAD-IIB family hydrolase [Terrimonas sp. NA20]|uniref:Cof-type HAD-IIB family hydrolase n=1 Tax=Terrimonas ginsenosidimutans TaxID=2908004 RepID=A0ABS9KT61_9BACT|nr:HAD family hydrolase [Terrimonas ginsenosidimutans]MCG2615526.1 Cof-type HAD-IIB family hydrolase [Terrimonas ginsenosidimutans]
MIDFSGIRLIAADMDGTLLNSKHEYDKGFPALYDHLKTKGVFFAPASGRQLYNLQNTFGELGSDMIFIAENGSHVQYQGRDLFVQSLPMDQVPELIRMARGITGVNIILCGKKQAYLESREPEFLRHVEMYYDRRVFVDDLLAVEEDDFLKIAICDLSGAEANSYPVFRHLEGELQVKVSGKIWLDLSHQLANKGRALQAVQQQLNISVEECMAFGDYLNDVEMMKQAYFSYAMTNAHPEVKKAARFETRSNEENGVGEVMQKVAEAIDRIR